jgi:hypothetical protein
MLSAALTVSLAALGAPAALTLAMGTMAAPAVPSPACPDPRAQAMDHTARASAPSSTQATNPPIRTSAPSRGELELRLPKLLGADKLAEARALVDAYLQEHPRDDGVLFDAARVASRQRDLRAAAAYATRALRAGWRDDAALDGHPDLEPLRAHESWAQVLAVRREMRPAGGAPDWSNPIGPTPEGPGSASHPAGAPATGTDRIASAALERWLDRFGAERYRVERDGELNVIFASGVDAASMARTRLMLKELAPALSRSLFGAMPPDTVLVAIATHADAERFFGDPQQSGLYEHKDRSLVSRDTGSSLRHEFVHLMHWGHMQRLGQRHPIWIQEGLATLFEDWRARDDGSIEILPNLRQPKAHEHMRGGRMPTWTELTRMSQPDFMVKADINYPAVRSIFSWITERGWLQRWYRAYTAMYAEDPTGIRALESVSGQPAARLEAQWREWVADVGPGALAPGALTAGLGIEARDATDGVRITAVQPGSPADRSGLRTGDVVVAIGADDVHSLRDLMTALSRRNAGETTQIRFRRGGSYSTVQVTFAQARRSPP